MKTLNDIQKERWKKNYPRSVELLNDALQYAIDNNQGWTRSGILLKELPEGYAERNAAASDIIALIKNEGGFYAVMWTSHGSIRTKAQVKEGKYNVHEHCYDLYIFFNKFELERYEKAMKAYGENRNFRTAEENKRVLENYSEFRNMEVYYPAKEKA